MVANPSVQNQGFYTTGLPGASTTAGTLGSVTLPLTGNESAGFDTNLGNGINPATIELTTNQLAAMDPPALAIPYAATVMLDMSQPTNFFVIGTLTGNITIANPLNLTSGDQWTIELTQDGTGSRTVTLGSLFKVVGAVSTTASYVDTLTCKYDGTKILAFYTNHFA